MTLNDTKTIVNKLGRMLNFIVAIVVLIIALLILELATTKFVVFLGSQVILVIFIFGNTCKAIFEAIIFLFVMHLFDIGDRCEIDGIQQMFIHSRVYRFYFHVNKAEFVPLVCILISNGGRRNKHIDNHNSEI